jgi:membrane protease YdiL (CAAX protease family)
MSPEMKVLVSALAIALALTAMRRLKTRRHIGDFALGKPEIGPLLLWVGIYIVWILATNSIWHWRGPWDFGPWKQASLLHGAERVLAVGILGPVAEELIFRGILYRLVLGTQLGVPGAIVISAAAWAPLHVQYAGGVILLLFVDGLLLGLSRHFAKSVWVPTAMHIAWNLFAVW